jgi:hypothetical protein
MARPPACAFLLLAALFSAGTLADQTNPTSPITIRKSQPVVEHKTFDPANKPREMPELSGNEAAVTSSSFGLAAEVQYLQVPRQKQVQITSVTVSLDLKITIWNPIDADDALKAHEEGHRRISERVYEDAATVARDAARPFIGRTIVLGDASPAARKKAIDGLLEEIGREYMRRIQLPAQRINQIYDQITRHGQNQRISVDDAIERAFERFGKE